MRKLLKTFALAAVAVVGAVSCSESAVDDIITPSGTSGVTLYATTPSEASTKVSFTDEGDYINLEWEAGDSFTLYDNNGDVVDTFTTTEGDGNFTSSKEDLILESDTTYTAKYKESANIYEQEGDEISNLDAACQMEATFTYGKATSLTFEHQMAIMTFEFESAERPAKLIFENGDESYTVTYTSIEPSVDNIYTSHIMVNPCNATDRTLTFKFYDSEETAYDIRTTTSSIAYEAGYRYTASTSSLATRDWSGSGTEADPYQIENATQLRQLSTNVAAGTNYSGEYFEMTCDIDLGGVNADGTITAENEFTTIGYFGRSFCGTFDGGGHEVSGLYINQPESAYQGLFGYIDSATIKNLGVSGSVMGQYGVGGVVGCAVSSTVSNCYNTGSVVGSDNYVGGVMGWSVTSTVSNCYNTGSVKGSRRVGGVVGDSITSATVNNCYNTGSVEGASMVGGVVGCSVRTVSNCYNTGSVYGSGDFVGGVVGDNIDATVSNCYNTGSVKGSDDSVGGVVGENCGTVSNCYNTGSVEGSNDSVGGVVGYSDEIVENCSYDSLVYEGDAVGCNDDGTVDNTEGNASLKTDMKDGSFAETLNGDQDPEPWKEDSTDINNGYPILTWQ
ncbi:MAG: GLUG motif-containing protein [Rikenellaceae bacterium]